MGALHKAGPPGAAGMGCWKGFPNTTAVHVGMQQPQHRSAGDATKPPAAAAAVGYHQQYRSTKTHHQCVHTYAQGKIKSLESIYLFSMPVKEYQIVEYFLGSALKDEVMKIMPVQKQTRAGQRTRFKVWF